MDHQRLDADSSLAFAEVGIRVDERRPVDDLHRVERRERVAGCHSGPDGVRVDPADRQDGHATTGALWERRLAGQRDVATDVVRTGVARLEAQAEDTSLFQPVVVDGVTVKVVGQWVYGRLVSRATRHCDRIEVV